MHCMCHICLYVGTHVCVLGDEGMEGRISTSDEGESEDKY